MKETITVYTGEIKTGDETVDLKSSPVGSCVVVVLFDEKISAGGMAHIMLPGKAPDNKDAVQGKYAENALKILIQEFSVYGVNTGNLKAKAVVVGGGNVLKRENDTIGTDNLDSVYQLLIKHKIKVVASSVKGTERKSVRFDIEHGFIFYTSGDGDEELLFRIIQKPQLIHSSHGTQ